MVPNFDGELHHLHFDTFDIDYISDYDQSPDPDGDDQSDGGDGNIPIRLKLGEHDADNNFILSIKKSWLVIKTMYDHDGDNIGDSQFSAAGLISLFKRNALGNPIGPEIETKKVHGYNSFVTYKDLDPGEYVIVFIGYDITHVEDENPDNNPPYEYSKPDLIPINIIDKEYDDGILILVKDN